MEASASVVGGGERRVTATENRKLTYICMIRKSHQDSPFENRKKGNFNFYPRERKLLPLPQRHLCNYKNSWQVQLHWLPYCLRSWVFQIFQVWKSKDIMECRFIYIFIQLAFTETHNMCQAMGQHELCSKRTHNLKREIICEHNQS